MSIIFDSYCMNLYGRQLFRYNDIKTWKNCIFIEYNQLVKYGDHHLDLIAMYCIALTAVIIENIMDKRCVKFILIL